LVSFHFIYDEKFHHKKGNILFPKKEKGKEKPFSEMASHYTYTPSSSEVIYNYRLVLLGDSNVGKSSILWRITDEHNGPLPTVSSTIGAAFRTLRTIIETGDKNDNVWLEMWDTAGQERYHAIAPLYYRNAHIIVLVYSIDNYGSFCNLQKWIDEVNTNEKKPIIYLLGNKNDLTRIVTQSEAKEFAERNNLIYKETSAKTDLNIKKIFIEIASDIHNNPLYQPTFTGGAGIPLITTVDYQSSTPSSYYDYCSC
jgi:small GTP-binding protein